MQSSMWKWVKKMPSRPSTPDEAPHEDITPKRNQKLNRLRTDRKQIKIHDQQTTEGHQGSSESKVIPKNRCREKCLGRTEALITK